MRRAMAKVTPGYKLYLYQLLGEALGFGKQTPLAQVEAILNEDDIVVEDLECSSMQELAQACPDFLKLTLFKKGRAYLTVLANEEWDQMLAAPLEKQPAAKPTKAAGPKSWKTKKTGKKSLKPVKPGKERRAQEALEAKRAEEEARLLAEQEEAARLQAEQEAQEVAEEALVEDASEEIADSIETIGEDVQDSGEPAAETSTLPNPADDGSELPAPQEPSSDEAADEQAAETPDDTEGDSPAEIEPTSSELPAAPAPAPISLTITYDPYEDMERELARQQEEALATASQERADAPAEGTAPQAMESPQASAQPIATQADGPAATAAQDSDLPIIIQPPEQRMDVSLRGLPQDFSAEVSCKDAQLRLLYHLLPYDMEPLGVLDEDWRVARSTGRLSGTRTRVSFPLRYLHEDGSPVMVTVRKTARSTLGKQWSLLLVDGDDGTGNAHEPLGFEGLPTADEGAWSDLSVARASEVASPVRELAQHVVVGTWESFLGTIASAAAPEHWDYPGEGVGKPSRYGILRDYLALTFHRVLCQDRLAVSADGSLATFCTGLLSPLGDELYVYLERNAGDIPWKFKGVAVVGQGTLGTMLTGAIAPLPDPPTYLSSLETVMVDHSRLVILDIEDILAQQLGRLPRSFLAELVEHNNEARTLLAESNQPSEQDLVSLGRIIRRDASLYRRLRRRLDDAVEQSLRAMKASYRLAAPIYDPLENRTKLIVPLALVQDSKADCALVLDLQPSGAYRAAVLLSLTRAYSCARVISREQPRWLAPSSSHEA